MRDHAMDRAHAHPFDLQAHRDFAEIDSFETLMRHWQRLDRGFELERGRHVTDEDAAADEGNPGPAAIHYLCLAGGQSSRHIHGER